MNSLKKDRVSLATKLAFGAGEFGPALSGALIIFFLLPFLIVVAGLSPGVAGMILMVSKLWDALTDPAMGWLTDRTKSRFGRRLPYMVLGTLPLAVIVALQWQVFDFASDPQKNETVRLIYYLAVGTLMQTLFTIVTIPYTTLTAEITENYDERTTLNGYRFGFSLFANIAGVMLAGLIFDVWEGDQRTAHSVLGMACGALIVIFLAWCVIGVFPQVRAREKRLENRELHHKPIPFLRQFQIALCNRPFVIVCVLYLFSWMAVQLTASVLNFYVIYWLKKDMGYFVMVILAVQGTAMLVLPFWAWLSSKLGKRSVFGIGTVFWIGAQTGLFFLPSDAGNVVFVLAVTAGLGVSVAYLIPWSMIPDIVEFDEYETGHRREGVFFGFMVLLQKLGLALALYIVGVILDMQGFVRPSPGETPSPVMEQPESALMAIRIIVGPIPMVCLVIAAILAWRFPITRDKHAAICRELEARRGNSDKDQGESS